MKILFLGVGSKESLINLSNFNCGDEWVGQLIRSIIDESTDKFINDEHFWNSVFFYIFQSMYSVATTKMCMRVREPTRGHSLRRLAFRLAFRKGLTRHGRFFQKHKDLGSTPANPEPTNFFRINLHYGCISMKREMILGMVCNR